MVRTRVRIRFRKEGDLRWISHRDLLRLFERLFRRAELPLAMSEGFHPKPKMTFPSALALGIAGAHEVMEFELSQPMAAAELASRLSACAPPGLAIDSVDVLPPGAPKVRVAQVTYEISVPSERVPEVRERLRTLQEQTSVPHPRNGREKPIELRPALDHVACDADRLQIRLPDGGEGVPRAREILAVLGLAELEAAGGILTRTQVETAS